MKERIENTRKNYKKIIWIAFPIAMQNLLSSSLNMIDTLMIGRLGEQKIAAVGIANQYFLVMILLLFGINSGVSIFISQFWGSGETGKIKKTLGIGVFSGLGVSILFGSLALFFAPQIFSIFTTDAEVVGEGVRYMRIVSFSLLAMAVTFGYAIASRSIGVPRIPLVISGVSLLMNTVLNLLLIFGIGPFPALGVEGAAIATLISRIFEMILIIIVVNREKLAISSTIKELAGFDFEYLKKVFSRIWPVVINEGIWSVGMSLYAVAYGRMGTEEFAAVRIAETISGIFFVAAVGIGNAGAIITGNLIGAKSPEVRIYAKRMMKLSIGIGFVLGIMMIGTADIVAAQFKVSGEVQRMTVNVLRIYGAYLPIKFLNTIYVIGLFRGGGDTKFSLFMELGSIYMIGVPLAFCGALYWSMPLYAVVVLVNMEEIVKTIVGYIRIRSDVWINDLTEV